MATVATTSLPPPRDGLARPGWLARGLAVAGYCGLAPLLLRFRRHDPFIQHHATQAVLTTLVFLALCGLAFLYWLALSWLIVYHRGLYESLPEIGDSPQVRDGIPIVLILLPAVLAWFGGLALALLGSRRSLPLLARLAGNRRWIRVAVVANVLVLLGVLCTTALAQHASSLTREEGPAPVYLLYDDMGCCPRWVFNLGFYRIARAATARWGPNSVVVAPLDEEHLRLALQHGRFVFLACHGRDGDIIVPNLIIAPAGWPWLHMTEFDGERWSDHWTEVKPGKELRLVYNTACDSGSKADEWAIALSPAEVKTFGRLSAVAEHIWWLWVVGPEQVRELPE
jgi:hypothetical protein